VSIREHIGGRIRTAREAAGLTLRELADLSGVSFQQIGQIEGSESGTTFKTLDLLLPHLGMRLEIVNSDDPIDAPAPLTPDDVEILRLVREGLPHMTQDEKQLLMLQVRLFSKQRG